jgi:hypothetical protein
MWVHSLLAADDQVVTGVIASPIGVQLPGWLMVQQLPLLQPHPLLLQVCWVHPPLAADTQVGSDCSSQLYWDRTSCCTAFSLPFISFSMLQAVQAWA